MSIFETKKLVECKGYTKIVDFLESNGFVNEPSKDLVFEKTLRDRYCVYIKKNQDIGYAIFVDNFDLNISASIRSFKEGKISPYKITVSFLFEDINAFIEHFDELINVFNYVKSLNLNGRSDVKFYRTKHGIYHASFFGINFYLSPCKRLAIVDNTKKPLDDSKNA